MFFPEDVLIQVLLRLPPKSVSRFKCVSKSWKAMFDSHQFMPKYFQLTYTDSLSSNHSLHLIFQTCTYYPTSLMFLLPTSECARESDEESDEKLIDLKEKGAPGITDLFGDVFDPKMITCYHHSVSGPINGIYCVNIIQHKPYHVEPQVCFVRVAFWNPGMGQFHVLPPIPRPAMLDIFIDLQHDVYDYYDLQHDVDDYYEDVRRLDTFIWGFVFDPVSEDYKYFSISEYGSPHRSSYYFVCFHLYSLASNSWQELHHSQITFPPNPDHVMDVYDHGRSCLSPVIGRCVQETQAFPFNGSCHWLYYGSDENGLVPKVLSFDIVEHGFRVSVIPPTLLGEERLSYVTLMTVDGCLAVASPSPILSKVTSVIGIIVMKEYGVEESWFRAYNIVLNSPAIFVSVSEDQLFVRETDGWVASYRLGAHHEEYNRDFYVPFEKFEMLPFEGSFIPLRPGH